MKIVVTGGAGFVGSHLVDTLVERGHDVIVIDHHQRKKMRFPNPKARVYRHRFSDEQVEEMLMQERPDAVCHLAAQISVTRSINEPAFDADVNIVQSLQFLEYARKAGVKHFVFASSGGAIYGNHPNRPTPEIFDATPISPYGVSKQLFEHFLASYGMMHDISWTSLRFSNIYGPRQLSAGEAGVVAIFLERLRTNREAIIFGDGSSTRDYLFVLDAVEAFVKALEGEYSGIVNVSSGKETSIQELWDTLVRIHGSSPGLSYGPYREGEVLHSVLDPAQAKIVLDWEAKTPLEEGLKQTYSWFMTTYGTEPQHHTTPKGD